MADFAYSIWQDIKFGFRMLRKTPAFTAAVVAILALGIGGNTAIFTITNALLLRALPYPKAKQLVLVRLEKKGNPDAGSALSLNLYETIRDHSHSFSGLAVFANDSLVLTGRGEPQQVPVARVSPNFLDVIGIRPELGRNFTADEGQTAGNPVVILSNNLWRSRFASDPTIVGKTVRLDASSVTVVGVLPDVQFP